MEETNPYLALRAEKIARNEARLKELGLLQPTTTLARVKTSERRKRSDQPRLPQRRSSRRARQPDTYLELAGTKRRKVVDKDAAVIASVPRTLVPAFPAHSARGMNVNVHELRSLFGIMMARTGKAFVMEECAQCLCSNHSGKISFNKYSGVQEMKNAMFLWINLGNGGDVVNEFLDGGRKVCDSIYVNAAFCQRVYC